MADHYAVLGVRPDADRTAIQTAYRELARIHHPDFGGDGTRMAALNEAWAVLSRDETRRVYDRSRGTAHGYVTSGTAHSRSGGAAPTQASTPPPQATGPIGAAAARRGVDPRGRTLGFGRYTGWTVAELAAHDPDYLEWLARAPAGLAFRQEIYAELARRPAAQSGRAATATRPAQSRSRFGRRRLW